MEEVAGMCFDPTALNSGPSNGTCAILERKIGRPLLYLACRHHIYELTLKAVYEKSIGLTSGPDILLFKRFQGKWPELNHDNYKPGTDDLEVLVSLGNEQEIMRILEFT